MVILKELQLVLMPICFISIPKEVFDKNKANGTGGVEEGGGRRKDIAPPIFSEQKGKKGEKRKKRKTFKAETLKSLSLSSKCYCFSHS